MPDTTKHPLSIRINHLAGAALPALSTLSCVAHFTQTAPSGTAQPYAALCNAASKPRCSRLECSRHCCAGMTRWPGTHEKGRRNPTGGRRHQSQPPSAMIMPNPLALPLAVVRMQGPLCAGTRGRFPRGPEGQETLTRRAAPAASATLGRGSCRATSAYADSSDPHALAAALRCAAPLGSPSAALPCWSAPEERLSSSCNSAGGLSQLCMSDPSAGRLAICHTHLGSQQWH